MQTSIFVEFQRSVPLILINTGTEHTRYGNITLSGVAVSLPLHCFMKTYRRTHKCVQNL
jgi:hypothetical protein